MDRVNVVTYMPVSVSPNPNIFKKEWIEETVSSSSARHSRASEVSPARSFVEAIFWQKLSRAVQENRGVGDPTIFRMARWSAPKMARFYTRAILTSNFTEPLFNAIVAMPQNLLKT
jgi:hypothetical protein